MPRGPRCGWGIRAPSGHEPAYASLRLGAAVLGLGPIAKLPAAAPGPGFSQQQLASERGAGVEIVLEVEDLD